MQSNAILELQPTHGKYRFPRQEEESTARQCYCLHSYLIYK